MCGAKDQKLLEQGLTIQDLEDQYLFLTPPSKPSLKADTVLGTVHSVIASMDLMGVNERTDQAKQQAQGN